MAFPYAVPMNYMRVRRYLLHMSMYHYQGCLMLAEQPEWHCTESNGHRQDNLSTLLDIELGKTLTAAGSPATKANIHLKNSCAIEASSP
jgi:hypothetical protein